MSPALVLLTFALLSNADTPSYIPPDVSVHVAEFGGKYRIILEAAKDPAVPLEERLVRFQTQLAELRGEFVERRAKEYRGKSLTLSVEHSCTSGASGGVKDCGVKCVSSPSEHLYTSQPWVSVAGTNKGTSVSETQACLRMTVAGKGRNAGTLTARYEYRPASVESLSQRDADALFRLIALSLKPRAAHEG
ncbi:hypothetical protein EJ065_2624 [Corallococcus coralloides]|uniref:Uncharacterized protein n=1 Tax=Corallococcus coralloides TaxID=184914 RepID=A0A410RQN6_CORCK|nr:hypothetical protein EJ065_2624 [Corallococcus coralloides]